jgi:thiosulfate dehydrogenase [quinone] large subunit
MRLPGEIVQGILARAALALLRIYMGTIFVITAVPKLGEDAPQDLIAFLDRSAQAQAQPFYRELLHDIVLPNAQLLAGLASWGQLFLGICLILGLTTRLWAAVALVFTLSYMVGTGAWPWIPGSHIGAISAISMAMIIGAGGRTLGLDSVLARRWPRSPLW